MNNTTGVASTAGKFAAAFALAGQVFEAADPHYSSLLRERSLTAFQLGLDKPGVCQTASVLSPYIYAEDNWTDDMELAAADNNKLDQAYHYALAEPVTPWLGKDTAKDTKTVAKDTKEVAKTAAKDTKEVAKRTGTAIKQGVKDVGHKIRGGDEKPADSLPR